MNSRHIIEIPYRDDAEFPGVTVTSYWDGTPADPIRHFSASLGWNDNHLTVRFEATVGEPLVVSESPILNAKTIGLWDRDVCEIFLAPDKNEPRKYVEFEVAPTGEWLDVGIDLTSGERITDWDYVSEMKTAANIEDDSVTMVITMPWRAFGKKPKVGDVWLGNLFRCVGKDPNRGYLAWRPTLTETPAFHVPEKFGEFVFVD